MGSKVPLKRLGGSEAPVLPQAAQPQKAEARPGAAPAWPELAPWELHACLSSAINGPTGPKDRPNCSCAFYWSFSQYLVNEKEMAVKWSNGKSMGEGEGPEPQTAKGGKGLFLCLQRGGDSRQGPGRGRFSA